MKSLARGRVSRCWLREEGSGGGFRGQLRAFDTQKKRPGIFLLIDLRRASADVASAAAANTRVERTAASTRETANPPRRQQKSMEHRLGGLPVVARRLLFRHAGRVGLL